MSCKFHCCRLAYTQDPPPRYPSIDTYVHTYTHTRIHVHAYTRGTHVCCGILVCAPMRVTSYQSTYNAFQSARFSILSLRITWINVFKGICPPFHPPFLQLLRLFAFSRIGCTQNRVNTSMLGFSERPIVSERRRRVPKISRVIFLLFTWRINVLTTS